MSYFWLLKRRWIAERGRHLPVGSRTAGNCWIWITAQELGRWCTAFHSSPHGLNPRQIPAVHKLTGFCCLLLKLSYQRHRLWSTSLVALGKNRALLLQFPADSATNRMKVVWGYLGAGTGTFCAHPNWAVSPSFVLSRRSSLLCLQPIHRDVQTDPELGNRANFPREAAAVK